MWLLFWHCLYSCVFKTQSSSRKFTPDDINRSRYRKAVFEENEYNGKCTKSPSHFEAVGSSIKPGYSCQIVCTLSKQKVITFMWLMCWGLCFFCQLVVMLQICEHLQTEPLDRSDKRQWNVPHASVCAAVPIFAIRLPVPKIIALCRKFSCFLDYLSPEDGASELFRNVGKYRSTRCHIPKDWNLPKILHFTILQRAKSVFCWPVICDSRLIEELPIWSYQGSYDEATSNAV